MSREAVKIIVNGEYPEGVGALVRRGIGSIELREYDPFLMLDEGIISDPNKAGFPDHPHRGFETVTYIITGEMKHEDFKGHKGTINTGDVQWMTAGRGIMHSEMPSGNSPVQFLQLWINLAKDYKMIEPKYQEYKHKEIPQKSENGVSVKVIAGESMGLKSQIKTITPTLYLDFKLEKGCQFTQTVPEDWNGFILVLKGNAVIGEDSKQKRVSSNHTVILSKGNSVTFKNEDDEQLNLFLIAGHPLNEPIARHGPFVMNTDDEIQQTIDDYKNCRNGFEHARNWESDAKKKSKLRDQ